MSNFSFSHCVFKRCILQTRKNQGLFGKGLTNPKIVDFILLKAFGYNKIICNGVRRRIIVTETVLNTVGKEEFALPTFSKYLALFSKGSSLCLVKYDVLFMMREISEDGMID